MYNALLPKKPKPADNGYRLQSVLTQNIYFLCLKFLFHWSKRSSLVFPHPVVAGVASLGGEVSVAVRNSLLLDCKSVGSPPPRTVWYHNQNIITHHPRFTRNRDDSLLIKSEYFVTGRLNIFMFFYTLRIIFAKVVNEAERGWLRRSIWANLFYDLKMLEKNECFVIKFDGQMTSYYVDAFFFHEYLF